ncbi:MAG: anhydro-N-acetylmuramic acid kinase [Bosea sp. (in: a-proteobacteria)]
MSQELTSAIGAISGTSMDGIDIAFIRTDGRTRVETGPGCMMPYPADLRHDLLELLKDPAIAERDPLVELERRVTEAFTRAIAEFMQRENIDPRKVDLIGLHGQTVFHRPERRFTRQLGRGDLMASSLGIAVVDAFRQADIKAGGHGAPLAPLYHAALAAPLAKPVMILNLGGVGNVTFIGADEIIAFDTGPASALIDDMVMARFGKPYDDGGRIAAHGTVNQSMLVDLMANPFFDAPAPKSLDRQDFHARAAIVRSLGDADAVATLTAFTIDATVAALRHVPEAPSRWLVTGGGRHNLTLMEGLSRRLGVSVEPVEAQGWNGDLVEAQAFGYLAVRTRDGLPLSLPTTTGVPRPMRGGVLWLVSGLQA